MKNFTEELKNILKEDPGAPIMSPDQILSRTNTMVILTNDAPRELLALAGPTRKAILLNYKPLMITFPDQQGVYKVEPDDIVFENHHTGRDVTEAGSEETDYEKFFAQAMKKFGVSSPIELSPEDTKKFFNYVDKNWDAEEESDGSTDEVGWDDPPRSRGGPSLITPNEDVSTGKVGKKDKGSYQHAYKLALKKYKIHSADELDTPAERKGFTAYVDRLWKGGEVHRDKKEAAIGEDEAQDREREREQKEKQRENDQRQRERERDQDEREKAQDEREREQDDHTAAAVALTTKVKKQESSKSNKSSIIPPKKKKKKKKKNPFSGIKKKNPFSGIKKKKKKAAKKAFSSHFKGGGVGGGIGKVARATQSSVSKYQTKEASVDKNEVSPPDRKHQVKGIKKHMSQKKGKDKIPKTYVDKKTGKRKKTNPWALAWAQYDKYGVPSRIEKD